MSDAQETITGAVDKEVGTACSSDDLAASGDYPTIDADSSDMLSKISALAPPPKPAASETTRQIEVLCQYIAKNGPAFEVAARSKEHENPKFAFLFGGEPGSEAAIAHEYFKWMKAKCLMESKIHSGFDRSDPLLGPSKLESSRSPDKYTGEGALHSPAGSDMDMEDDQSVGAPVKVSKVFDPAYREVLDVKNQQPDNQCMIDNPTTTKAPPKIESSFGTQVLARQEREYDDIPFWSSAGDSERIVSPRKLAIPVENLIHPKASPTAAAADIDSKRHPDPVSNMGSPFRLIQDYASDDSSEANDGPSFEDVSPERVSPSIIVDSHEEGTNVEMGSGSLSSPLPEKELLSLPESHLVHPANMPSPNISTETPKVVEATDARSVPSYATANSNEVHQDGHDFRTSDDLNCGNSLQGDDNVASENGKLQEGGEKQSSSVLKVDEFGRIVREGASDSESDEEHYTGRHYRRGRSRSPLDRRRRRTRSPRRRNEKRNRSRSWSPRKQRSTSRSPPVSRHTGEFSGEKKRWDKDHTCFDFLKGRCHRGASCRFLHNRSGTGDASRRYRSRQEDKEYSPDPRRSFVQGESCSTVELHDSHTLPAKHEHDSVEEVATKVQMPHMDMDVSNLDVSKDRELDATTDADPALDDVHPVTSVEVSQTVPTVILEVSVSDSVGTTEQGSENQQVMQSSAFQVCEIPKLPEETNELLMVSQPITEADTLDMSGRIPLNEPSSTGNAECPSSPAKIPNGEASETNTALLVEQHLHSQNINTSHPTPSESFVPQIPTPNATGENNQLQHSQLPLPPPPPPLGNTQVSQPPRDYNLQSGATNVHPHSSSVEGYLSYQAPNDQYLQAPAPSKPSWNSLPPPPPPPYVQGSISTVIGYSQSSHPSQYPAPLMRPYPHGQPSHSQGIDYRSPSGAPLMPNQPLEYPNVLGDERFSRSSVLDGSRFRPGLQQGSSVHPLQLFREEHHFPHQTLDGSRNFQLIPNQRQTSFMAQDSLRGQALPFPNEPPAKRFQSFSDGNLHHNPFLKEDFGGSTVNHSFPRHHQPQSTYGLQWSGPASFPSHSGSVEHSGPSVRRYPLSFEDDSKRPHLPFAGGSRISAHFNPYASTFENIHESSAYKSNFKQESLTSVARFDSLGLNQASQPALDKSQGQMLSKSGDPYDPLFDSIEPAKASRKFDFVDGGDFPGDVISKSVGTRSTIEPLNITNSNYSHGAVKKEEKEQIDSTQKAAVTSPENDEFGEPVVDAEVGALESGSPENAIDLADTAMDDVEIDQVPSKGKSKKSKDSRSMKLFKVALADFVKDVLKPSWRQGNMSKEAFKTIVKKTVDKVAGAMKSHQIPKGQAKINQYVESSQRKLTKLVMGYVDKYVKA